MKKLIAFGLLFSFLSSTTELHEVFKIPHLVQHYFEHGLETGLINFLHIHYAHDHENHQDEHHDKGCLPFQGSHASPNVSIAALSAAGASSLNLKPQVRSFDHYLPYSEFAISRYQTNIWQPPKIG